LVGRQPALTDDFDRIWLLPFLGHNECNRLHKNRKKNQAAKFYLMSAVVPIVIATAAAFKFAMIGRLVCN
jgi:hypothetical protein